MGGHHSLKPRLVCVSKKKLMRARSRRAPAPPRTVKRLPESFRIVFLMPPSARDRFVSGRVPGISPDQVGGLYINVQYENQEMICVTGTSMKQFTLDRTLENEWDENVKKFLKKNGVVFS